MLWFLAPVAFAQSFAVPYNGQTVSCSTPAGVQVLFIPNPSLADVGMAYPAGSISPFPVIVYNPLVLQQLPTSLGLFWLAHECGHQKGYANETQADCWAVKTGMAQGWFTIETLYQAALMLQNNSGDWTHLPGPQRVQSMALCMQH